MNIDSLLLFFLLSLLVTFSLMPLNFYICKKFGFVDVPEKRKVHTTVKYRAGGISIYLTFFLFLMVFYFYYQETFLLVIALSSLVLFVTGVIDDKLAISAKAKLVGQITSALIVFFGGIQIEKLNLIFAVVELNYFFSFITTILWILLLMNAINLIDGLDGLASGVSIFILMALFIFTEDPFVQLLSVVIIASLLVFLKYNFFPSKIFLGDTGSLFLGYIIAVLSIIGTGKSVVGVTTILLLCSFPLLDVFLAIVRRLLNHKPIFSADKNHIHHCLMNLGYSHKNSVLMIYLINLGFIVLAYITLLNSIYLSILVTVLYCIYIVFLIKRLDILKIEKK